MQYMIVHYVLVGLVLVVLVCLLLRNVHDAHNAPFRVGGVGLQREREYYQCLSTMFLSVLHVRRVE